MSRKGPVDSTLVTGFPSYTARRLVSKLLEADPQEQVHLLLAEKHSTDAEQFVASLPASARKRITLLFGDVASMDLGLSGKEYRTLAAELTNIHHMAAHLQLRARKEIVEQVNVGGTRGVMELALECRRLRRFNFWSTVLVAGDRQGVVMEDELVCGQRFQGSYEQSKYQAEKVVRSMSRRVPCTIFRPGIIVGDTRTGEIDRYDGLYHLLALMVDAPIDVHLPMPGGGHGPLHLVPVDYVVQAAYTLSRMDSTVSKTFHLVDPCPLSANSVYQLVADRAHRRPAKGLLPAVVARTLLQLPGIGRLGHSVHRSLLDSLERDVYFNCRNTLEALQGTDVWCPAFDSYVDSLVRYVKDARAARRRRMDDDVSDPLD